MNKRPILLFDLDETLINTKSTKLMSLKISYSGTELLTSEKSKEIISQNREKFVKIAKKIEKYVVVQKEESKEISFKINLEYIFFIENTYRIFPFFNPFTSGFIQII